MKGHRYFINGIPLALWKEYRHACIYFDTTAKDHLISCMSELVSHYHESIEESKAGPIYTHSKEKKK
ncbi:hypothetical protein ES702_05754 [subsurface metagenome]